MKFENPWLKLFLKGRTQTRTDKPKAICLLKVKVKKIQKWYATLRHPKMHPYNQNGIPTFKNLVAMLRTGLL